MTDIIYDTTRRTRGYWFLDGLAEIGSGILFIIISIPYFLWSLAPPGSNMAKLASMGRDILLLSGLITVNIVIWIVKQRSTYIRTGYIEERRPGQKLVLKMIAITMASMLVFAGLMTVGILFFPAFPSHLIKSLVYFPAVFGLLIALSQVVIGFRTAIQRFFILAGIAALTGVGLAINSFIYLIVHPADWRPLISNSYRPIPAEGSLALLRLLQHVYQSVAFFGAVFGMVILTSGITVRRKYLRKNMTLPEEKG